MKKYIIVGLILFFSIKVFGQNTDLASIKVTRSFSNSLDAIFLDLGTSYKVRFSYDWYTIHQYSFNGSFNNASMDSVMNVICKKSNLKYYFDGDILTIEKIKVETDEE
jgi:hypothetical protein